MGQCQENAIANSTSLLIGNSLAVLIGAYELARRGKSLTWLTDGRGVGGHFAGVDVAGSAFDVGMVFLEKIESADRCASLETYNPLVRNDWVRFGPTVTRWIESHCNTVRTPTPQCLVGGREVADYLLANRLDAIRGEASIRLSLEQPQITRQDSRHPVHKSAPGTYDHVSYQDAALLAHGRHFHTEYVEPFVRKVLGVSSGHFLARFHRVAWAPLYYPETLAAAALGQPTGLSEYLFWSTSSGLVGELVRGLWRQVAACPQVTVVEQPIESMASVPGVGWRVAVNGQDIAGPVMAMGLPSDRICTLLGIASASLDAASVAIGFFLVREETIKNPKACLMVVDDTFAAYRVTDQDAAAGRDVPWRRVTLEASPGRLQALHPGRSLPEAMEKELRVLLGVDEGSSLRVKVLRCMTASNALTIPTLLAAQETGRVHDRLREAMPGTALTSNLLALGAGSLNDQVVQGLKIAEEWA